MNQAYNVSSAPKTTTFQMRMNPEIKQRAEQLYASYGLNLTDAINIFIQQSLNVEGLPFLLSPENEEYMKNKALKRLMAELDAGWKSAEQGRWVSEEEAMPRLEHEAEIYAARHERPDGNSSLHSGRIRKPESSQTHHGQYFCPVRESQAVSSVRHGAQRPF